MAIDWSQPICTISEPRRYGITQPDCPISGKKRVMFSRNERVINPDKDQGTVFHFSPDGICRVDGAAGPMDVMNVPAAA